jgi:hypothetical protein
MLTPEIYIYIGITALISQLTNSELMVQSVLQFTRTTRPGVRDSWDGDRPWIILTFGRF